MSTLNCSTFSLCSISVIVNNGLSHKVVKIAKECGALGSTTVLCRGTVNNKFLELLDLNEDRRELVFIISERQLAESILESLNMRLKLYKPNHGIAFATEICAVKGMHHFNLSKITEIESDTIIEKKESDGKVMYNSIYVVVDKGKGNEVIETSKKAGAKGGTIFGARGFGVHETNKLFSMEVEPEKEVVLIIASDSETQKLTDAIVKDMKLEEPGNGVLYVQKLTNVYGLY